METENLPEWLPLAVAAQRLSVTQPRLRRYLALAKYEHEHEKRDYETKTGTRTGVCVRVSALPKLAQDMGTKREREPKQEHEQNENTDTNEGKQGNVFTFSDSTPGAAGERVVPGGDAVEVATLRAENRMLAAEVERLNAQLLHEQRRAENDQQLELNRQKLALVEIERARLLPAPGADQEQNAGDGKKNGGTFGGGERVVARLKAVVLGN